MTLWIEGDPNVPEITDGKLKALLARIRPVVKRDGELWHIAPVDPRGTAFTWSPVVTAKAEGLVEIGHVFTDHTCAYHGFFKPSLAEVLAQIPDALADRITAFRTATDCEGDDEIAIYQSGGGHRAKTFLYAPA